MGSRPPPRLVVRRHDDVGQRWRRLWWGLGWLGSLAVVAVLAYFLNGPSAPTRVDHRQQRALLAEVDDLKQQVANLQRAAQVNEVATTALRGTLTQREKELSALRADLGFYSRLVSGDDQRQGLKLQEVKLQPISGSRGWNLTLSLTQNVRRDKATVGAALVSIEGLRDNKVVQLDWSALGDTTNDAGLPFQFRYFQQLHGTIVLPADFRPTRLRIRLNPTGGEAFTRVVTWADALRGHQLSASGESDVPS